MDRLLERQPSMGRTALLKRRGTAPARITGSLACQCDTASSDRSSTPHLLVTDTGGRPASQPTPAARKPSRSDSDGVPGQTTQLEKATDDPGNQMSSSSMALPENRTGPPCRCGSLDNVDTELRQMVFDAMQKLDQRRLVEINQGVAEQARRNYCSMMDNCTNSGFLSGRGFSWGTESDATRGARSAGVAATSWPCPAGGRLSHRLAGERLRLVLNDPQTSPAPAAAETEPIASLLRGPTERDTSSGRTVSQKYPGITSESRSR